MTKSRKTRSSSKSNAATLFNRYVWLVDTIYRAGRITFEEINERWQRSSLNETGEELPLPTGYNNFTAYADRDYSDCSPEAAANAQLLEDVMKKHGFSFSRRFPRDSDF